MESLRQFGVQYIKSKLYPFTFEHIIYLIFFTAVTWYITDYFLNYKLLKWIYVGTICVILASVYKQGDKTKVAEDIFKLATV